MRESYCTRFQFMAQAFGLTNEELDKKLFRCESRGSYHFWIVCCADLMRHYAQIEWKRSHKGAELPELSFKAYIQKAWIDGGPFDQFIESHLAEIKEQFMMQYAEFV